MIKIIKLHFKNMLHSKEFFIIFICSLIILLTATIGELITLYGINKISLAPAWYYFGYTGPIVGNALNMVIAAFIMFILPFLGSIAYAHFYYDAYNENITPILINRVSRNKYLITGAITVFIGGFLVVFVPLILSKLLLCTAIPLESIKIMPDYPTKDLMYRNVNFLKDICLNNPYLYYFIYTLIPALYAGLSGVLSLAVSFFIKKNRFFIITFPGMAYIIACFLLSVLGKVNIAPYLLLMPSLGIKGIQTTPLILLFVLLFAINIMLITVKLFFKKDEI